MKNEAAAQLGKLGGLKTAQTHDRAYYQEKAKHMNEVKAKKRLLQNDIVDKSANV